MGRNRTRHFNWHEPRLSSQVELQLNLTKPNLTEPNLTQPNLT